MARAILLQDMRGATRERANNQRASDATINRSLNQHLAELYDRLVQARGEQYYKSPTPLVINTIANVDRYALDDALYKELGVWWEVGPNDHRELLPYDLNKARGPRRTYGWNQYNGAIYYAIEQQFIRFQPCPTSPCKIVIDYVPGYQDIADGETFDGVNGWEDYAVYKTSAELARDENDLEQAAALEGKADILGFRVDKMAANRSLLNPPRMLQRRGRPMREGGGGGAYLDDDDGW